MTKNELINSLSKKNNIKEEKMKEFVDGFFNLLEESLINKERIELRNFGSFSLRKRKSYIGRNPKTGKLVKIPEKHTIYWRSGRNLRGIM